MPELPEVEVVRRGLTAHAAGRRIASVSVRSDRAVRRHLAGRNDFSALLAGREIREIRRRGKYLWWVLDGGDAVIAHLGMSGQFRVGSSEARGSVTASEARGSVTASEARGSVTASEARRSVTASEATGSVGDHPHLRIRFTFDDGGPDLDFLDQRTFGGMSFSPGGGELPPEIAHIGRDPLDPEFDPRVGVAAIRAKRTEIKRALLDQTVVSGIGNIYADEALWRAKLHYSRPSDRLPRLAVSAVLAAATEVMTEALQQGGTSFDSLYVNVNGESGYFDRSLAAYGQEGLACPRCGTAIRREPFMNRSSFFCPRCQHRARRTY